MPTTIALFPTLFTSVGDALTEARRFFSTQWVASASSSPPLTLTMELGNPLGRDSLATVTTTTSGPTDVVSKYFAVPLNVPEDVVISVRELCFAANSQSPMIMPYDQAGFPNTLSDVQSAWSDTWIPALQDWIESMTGLTLSDPLEGTLTIVDGALYQMVRIWLLQAPDQLHLFRESAFFYKTITVDYQSISIGKMESSETPGSAASPTDTAGIVKALRDMLLKDFTVSLNNDEVVVGVESRELTSGG